MKNNGKKVVVAEVNEVLLTQDPEIVCESKEITGDEDDESENVQNHMTDHQYIAGQSQQDDDYERKEMDVFDYIGFEIRNIEEREKELMEKGESAVETDVLEMNEEMIIEEENVEEFYIESGEIKKKNFEFKNFEFNGFNNSKTF